MSAGSTSQPVALAWIETPAAIESPIPHTVCVRASTTTMSWGATSPFASGISASEMTSTTAISEAMALRKVRTSTVSPPSFSLSL